MGGLVGMAEEVCMQFTEVWPLVAAAGCVGDAANVSGTLHGAEGRDCGDVFRHIEPGTFIQNQGSIEEDVVTDIKQRLVDFDVTV